MTTPNPVFTQAPQLLSSDDLAAFQAKDADWFLQKAGEVIRSFCQWHIAPSVTETVTVPIKPDGTIELPSLYVTGVQSVTIQGLDLDRSVYHWHESGYIRHHQFQVFEWPPWPLQNDQPFREYPSPTARHAQVMYTHGYPTLPDVVAAVGLELATRAMELPSGVATDISAGPQTISFGPLGLVLTDEERRRLGPFTLVRF